MPLLVSLYLCWHFISSSREPRFSSNVAFQMSCKSLKCEAVIQSQLLKQFYYRVLPPLNLCDIASIYPGRGLSDAVIDFHARYV